MAQGKRILQCLLFPAGWLVLASIPITAAGLILYLHLRIRAIG